MDVDELPLIDALAQALVRACSARDDQMVRDTCSDIRLLVNDHGLLAIINMVKRHLLRVLPSRRPVWVLADVANEAYMNMMEMSNMLDSLSADDADAEFVTSKADLVTSIDSSPYAIVKMAKENTIAEQQSIAHTYFFDDERCLNVLTRIHSAQGDICAVSSGVKSGTKRARVNPQMRSVIKRPRASWGIPCRIAVQ
jgi:hypothetical protein